MIFSSILAQIEGASHFNAVPNDFLGFIFNPEIVIDE
jgi:hypothetical protein